VLDSVETTAVSHCSKSSSVITVLRVVSASTRVNPIAAMLEVPSLHRSIRSTISRSPNLVRRPAAPLDEQQLSKWTVALRIRSRAAVAAHGSPVRRRSRSGVYWRASLSFMRVRDEHSYGSQRSGSPKPTKSYRCLRRKLAKSSRRLSRLDRSLSSVTSSIVS